VYSTPGYSDESYNIYYAELEATRGKDNPDEDERIKVVYMTADEIDTIIAKGEMLDAKTIIAWMLYKQKIIGGESLPT
ncbi:MAG: hypothetical protein JXN60_00040, partial [Lentisphaerae bacterium]|nr:hypothetical protein [Lentisphaerota bacterium]